jgi:hypothetical protein
LGLREEKGWSLDSWLMMETSFAYVATEETEATEWVFCGRH